MVSIVDERFDREETDPQVTLDRLQITEHGMRLAALQEQQDKLYGLVRKIARRLNVTEDP